MKTNNKKALATALKVALLKKPLNRVSITDLTEDCGISRRTFYHYFKDIYELVDWVCSLESAEALKKQEPFKTWEQGYIRIFHTVKEIRFFIMNIYRYVGREQVERYLAPLIDNLLSKIIEEQSDGLDVTEENKKYVAKLYSHVLIGVMIEWISENMEDVPEFIVRNLSKVIQVDARYALKRLAESNVQPSDLSDKNIFIQINCFKN